MGSVVSINANASVRRLHELYNEISKIIRDKESLPEPIRRDLQEEAGDEAGYLDDLKILPAGHIFFSALSESVDRILSDLPTDSDGPDYAVNLRRIFDMANEACDLYEKDISIATVLNDRTSRVMFPEAGKTPFAFFT